MSSRQILGRCRTDFGGNIRAEIFEENLNLWVGFVDGTQRMYGSDAQIIIGNSYAICRREFCCVDAQSHESLGFSRISFGKDNRFGTWRPNDGDQGWDCFLGDGTQFSQGLSNQKSLGLVIG
jgi:hypothetical protein